MCINLGPMEKHYPLFLYCPLNPVLEEGDQKTERTRWGWNKDT